MRIEDVKVGMRVKYEYDGEVDYGVVKRVNHPPQTCDVDVEVWCDWEEKGAYLWSSPEYITPAEENTPKFKVGDKVVVMDTDGGPLNLGDIVTINSVERSADQADGYFYTFEEAQQGSGLFERRLAPYTVTHEDNPSFRTSTQDTGSAATSSHYNSKLIQPIEIVQMVLTKEEFCGAMKFNIIKYSQRAGSKEGESSDKDWKKALQYKLWLELAEQGVRINPREHVV